MSKLVSKPLQIFWSADHVRVNTGSQEESANLGRYIHSIMTAESVTNLMDAFVTYKIELNRTKNEELKARHIADVISMNEAIDSDDYSYCKTHREEHTRELQQKTA